MVAWAQAPASAPAVMRCAGVISSGSGVTTCTGQAGKRGALFSGLGCRGTALPWHAHPCTPPARPQAAAERVLAAVAPRSCGSAACPTRLSASFSVSLMAVSGAIFTTLVPLPLKNARTVPAAAAAGQRRHGTSARPHGGCARPPRGATVLHHVCRQCCTTMHPLCPLRTFRRHLAHALHDGQPPLAVLYLQQHLEPVYRRGGCPADRARYACSAGGRGGGGGEGGQGYAPLRRRRWRARPLLPSGAWRRDQAVEQRCHAAPTHLLPAAA